MLSLIATASDYSFKQHVSMITPLSRFGFKPAFFCLAGILTLQVAAAGYETSRAETPLRPLPEPQNRPQAGGPAYFVDARTGDDGNAGSKERPWRSVSHAVQRLSPGDTLYLRGGTYYERVNMPKSGRPDAPITIRAHPGELAILDGGIREFHDRPAEAWEPCPDGVPGEYRSTATYVAGDWGAGLDSDENEEDEDEPAAAQTADKATRPSAFFKEGVKVRGNFGASMIPVRGYTRVDFRSDNVHWGLQGGKYSQDAGLYIGPGVWYNDETRRIHIRLTHTDVPGITNYGGETDPRKIPLVIALRPPEGPRAGVLNLRNVRHLRFQDLVVRGSADTVINMEGSEDIELDHLTVYGAPGLSVGATSKLRIVHSAFRGLTSPWESRASMKYRGAGAYIIRHDHVQDTLTSHDWELANCEFTDSHDFIWMLGVKNLRFHHNYVDNFNDDGLEVGPKVKGQEIYIYENLISRCNGTLALHGPGGTPVPGEEWRDQDREVEPDSGVYIFRNVFDLRGTTYGAPPRKPGLEPRKENTKPDHRPAKITGEHGSPPWPQIFFYHNTVFNSGQPASFMDSYGFGIGPRGAKSKRRVFNNIFVQMNGWPSIAMAKGEKAQMRPDLDAQVDGNLFWTTQLGTKAEPRRLTEAERRPGWMERDVFADPMLTSLASEPTLPIDVRLIRGSPAADSGVAIPLDWPDTLRSEDPVRPDRGAIPVGATVPRIGVDGRLSLTPGKPSR